MAHLTQDCRIPESLIRFIPVQVVYGKNSLFAIVQSSVVPGRVALIVTGDVGAGLFSRMAAAHAAVASLGLEVVGGFSQLGG